MDLYRKTGSGRRYQGRGEDRDKYGEDIRILLGAVLGEAADFYHFMSHHFSYLYVVFICYLRGDTWLSSCDDTCRDNISCWEISDDQDRPQILDGGGLIPVL